MPNFKSVLDVQLVDFVDHPPDGGLPFVTIVARSLFYVSKFKFVLHFLLVNFGWFVTIPGMVADGS